MSDWVPSGRSARQRRGLLPAGRLAVGVLLVTIVAAVALTTSGTTLALTSATKTSASSLTAGRLALNKVTGATTVTCAVTTLKPGGSGTCKWKVAYTGSSAYLGLDVLVATKAGTVPTGDPTTAKPLYDGSATGLQVKVADGKGSTYVGTSAFTGTGTKYKTKAGIATTIPSSTCPATESGYTCYQVTDLLVNATAIKTGTATTDVVTTSYKLPTTATSGREGAVAKIILTLHGVQFGNDKATGCTAGDQCPATGTNFKWS